MRRFFFVLAVCIFLLSMRVHAMPDYSNKYSDFYVSGAKLYSKVSFKEGPTLYSYSAKWTSEKLVELYKELLNNFHGRELRHLNAIYLLPDPADGVAAYYYEDIRLASSGKFVLGDGAFIELYDMDSITEVSELAYTLAHEYGHHYTIYNICNYEQLYYSNWSESEYAKLRQLGKYPVIYDQSDSNYSYVWDIVEIAVNDYIQLLGSPAAKASFKYKDSLDVLTENYEEDYIPVRFNSRPQDNLFLPLATDVKGLYSYMKKISGVKGEKEPAITKRPFIKSIRSQDSFIDKTYTLTFTEAVGNGPFEYTIIMYPTGYPNMPYALKTIAGGELKTVFGTVVRYDDKGNLEGVFNSYNGVYEFRILAKDKNGFMFSSPTYSYDFGQNGISVQNVLGMKVD